MTLLSRWLETKVKGFIGWVVIELMEMQGSMVSNTSLQVRTSQAAMEESSPPDIRSQGSSVFHKTDLTLDLWYSRVLYPIYISLILKKAYIFSIPNPDFLIS